MTFSPSDTSVLIGFLVLVFSLIFLVGYGSSKGDSKTLLKTMVFLTVWNVITSLLVFSGVVAEKFIPVGVLLFASINFSAVYFSFSKLSEPFFQLPVWILVLFQSFRFPLELMLHEWVATDTVPSTMTWTGQNWDVVSGLLALTVLIPRLRTKKYFWFVNVVGIILLMNVLRVVVMSSPLPFSWPLENPIQLLMYFPYHFIATVCVWSAVVGHIILTRRLLRM